MKVVFEDVLPDTFTDDVEVVLEGRYRDDGVFEAATVLTKCGSRYEASAEEMVERFWAGVGPKTKLSSLAILPRSRRCDCRSRPSARGRERPAS